MNQTFRVNELEDLTPVAEALLESVEKYPIVLLDGPMGAGKTTLVKELARLIGIEDTSSPTFSLVNRYDGPKSHFYHFDLYRVEEEEELYDMGFEEYLDSGAPCFIEWPDIASSLIPYPHLHVTLTLGEGVSRLIEIRIQDRP